MKLRDTAPPTPVTPENFFAHLVYGCACTPVRHTVARGRILMATVEGDIHDIGKRIVATMLEVYGFEVHDLGRDVPLEDFIQKVHLTRSPSVRGHSTLLVASCEL